MDSYGNIAITIDGLKLLEKLYGFTPWHNRFLFLREIVAIPCRDDSSEPCYDVTAAYHPSSLRSEKLHGTVDELGKDLAVLVLRGAIRAHEEEDRERKASASDTMPRYLSAASTPAHMDALINTDMGLGILRKGTSHVACRGLQFEECKHKAREALETALSDRFGKLTVNPTAAMGLALLELSDAMRDARELIPARQVEARFLIADRLMKEARVDKYIRRLLSDHQFVDGLVLLGMNGVVVDDSLYDVLKSFRCALQSYRRANWQDCISRLGDINSYPAPVKPYLEAAQLEAKINSENNPETKARLGPVEIEDSRII